LLHLVILEIICQNFDSYQFPSPSGIDIQIFVHAVQIILDTIKTSGKSLDVAQKLISLILLLLNLNFEA